MHPFTFLFFVITTEIYSFGYLDICIISNNTRLQCTLTFIPPSSCNLVPFGQHVHTSHPTPFHSPASCSHDSNHYSQGCFWFHTWVRLCRITFHPWLLSLSAVSAVFVSAALSLGTPWVLFAMVAVAGDAAVDTGGGISPAYWFQFFNLDISW